MKSLSEPEDIMPVYYITIFSLYHGALVLETSEIDAIIVAIKAAKEHGFLYLVSANAVAAMLEIQREATQGMN